MNLMKQIAAKVWLGGIVTLLSLGLSTASFAGDKSHRHYHSLAGHYEGHLDLSAIGQDRLENVSIIINKGGTVALVVDEDGIEAESTMTGPWIQKGKNKIKFGVVQYRAGTRLCAILSERADDICKLRIGAKAKVNRSGLMIGELAVNLEEGDVSVPVGVITFEAQRTKVSDFPMP